MTATSSGSSSSAPSPRRSARPRVLLDANALLLPFRVGFPLLAEVERLVPGAIVSVPSSVRGEVARLADRGVAEAAAALSFAGRFPTIQVRARGDAGILRAARRHSSIVVTADRALTARLRAGGFAVLVPRDRHRLELRPAVRRSDRPVSRGNG